jgi:xylulokinase
VDTFRSRVSAQRVVACRCHDFENQARAGTVEMPSHETRTSTTSSDLSPGCDMTPARGRVPCPPRATEWGASATRPRFRSRIFRNKDGTLLFIRMTESRDRTMASRALGAPHVLSLRPRRWRARRAVRTAARASVSSFKARYACGLDVGTQSTKCLLYDIDTNVVAGVGSYAYDLLPMPLSRPHAAEQDPETWMDGISESLKKALSDADAEAFQIVSVGVSGQQHGMVALDKNFQVIRPAKLWCDTESAGQAAQISQHAAFDGWQMQAAFTASKVVWLRDEEPGNFAKTKQVCLPHDFINFRLTSVLATEAGDASGLGVFDLSTKTYDREKCAAVDPGLLTLLPKEIMPPDAQVGKVTKEASERTGLPIGAAVSTGSGDNACAAIGTYFPPTTFRLPDCSCDTDTFFFIVSGAGAVSPGTLVVSLGTSGTLFGASDTFVLDKSGVIAPFCDAVGGYLPLLCTLNCTRVVEEARGFCASGDGGALPSHNSLGQSASSVSPGCDGVQFLPYLVGERTPNWPDASGAIVGLRPGSLRNNSGVLYRAAMEGATYTLLTGLLKMQTLGVVEKPKELVLVGGGAKSGLWRQIVSDVFNIPVKTPRETESAALGAAKQAAAIVLGTTTKEFVQTNTPEFDVTKTTSPTAGAVGTYREGYESFVRNSNKLFA